ncbi:ODV-E43 [Buzura suppressaria nucleopolyhedrovirus]|uniref:ODV-E43 n=1 Tax=Buzura suppressaria nuclear polyhedrosis virus TaxID=74320 RepID=W5VKK9_NPVBS|nr:ODV-E43 [Buzura suppressaria nucleopolyhedrovirus]AHH82671.1 ODV-E43 [Buzura suppressaria nucleopolyhedrovirus]AKN91054.1 ODV-E43 [Buzura suppressaria nucleopolyhedrovirus]QYF10566.1 occlusion-derived virus envelope/capisid protein-43 [Buzura suppressaria nucleopolyhedrovirus]
MACSSNIKVCISTRFFQFPHEYVTPQNDVGNQPVNNLIVYVPTDEDVQYVDRKKLSAFASVRVLRHENTNHSENRLARKNPTSTIVYWNPIVPVDEIGVGQTCVFSVLLTNDLFTCNTMIIDQNNPLCPIEFRNKINYKKYLPIEGENPLFQLHKLLNDNINDFIICFKLETPTMVKILNIKKILCIFEYRNVAARYAIYLSDDEVDSIFNKLMWERVRRLMKGDVHNKCGHINRRSLQYMKMAMDLLGIDNNTKVVVNFILQFQPLIMIHQLVPDVIVKLNTLEKQKRVRLYCKLDSFAITSFGVVPLNMPDDNPYKFDYSDVNTNEYMFKVLNNVVENSKERHQSNESVGSLNHNDIKVFTSRYNYFF